MRAAAAEALVKFADAVPLTAEQLQAELLPPLRALAADSAQPVRVALAAAVLQMAPKLGPADSAGYLELIVTLLKDKARPPGHAPAQFSAAEFCLGAS